jgi:fermentation-respiration switch protein FrsA (DUF1100 family)
MRTWLLLPLLASGCMTLDGLIVPSHRLDAYDLSDLGVPEEDLELVPFDSTDGTQLWGLWAHQPVQDEPAPVLIDFHGNGGPMTGHEFERVAAHWLWGYEVFTFDYRGYGMAEGEPTRDGILEEDGAAAVRFVLDQTGLQSTDVVWAALSLGGAIAIHTNDEIDAKALVLESTFASTHQLIEEGVYLELPDGWFFDQSFDNAADIPDILSPVYVVHGTADDFVAPTHGDTLYRAAPDNPKWLWHPEGVHHSDITEVMPEEYERRFQQFVDDPTRDPNRASGG